MAAEYFSNTAGIDLLLAQRILGSVNPLSVFITGLHIGDKKDCTFLSICFRFLNAFFIPVEPVEKCGRASARHSG